MRFVMIKLILALVLLTPASGLAITINFDQLSGMNFLGSSVPAASQLSDQLQPSTGAVFSTLGGANYVAVVNLEIGSPSPHAPSPPNGIGSVASAGTLSYGPPIMVSFFDLASPTTPAVTNFVSITGDLRAIAGDIIMQTYDVTGSLLDTASLPDQPGGRVISLSTPGIHFFTVHSTSGSVAFDDLTFNEVSGVPLPGALILFGSGIVFLMTIFRRRSI